MNYAKKNSVYSALILGKPIILIIIGSMCFINSNNGDFVFDDSEAIMNNNDVKETPIYQLFQNDFWGTKITNKDSHKSYRPITILSFRIHYWLTGNIKPQHFHILNILLHTFVCILLLYVYQIFLEWKNFDAAFHATLLYAVHPVHTEAVSGIVGRADVLSALFMWLSIILYYKCIYAKNLIKGFAYISLSILSTAIGMLCKEIGLTGLGLCVLYDITVINKMFPCNILKFLRLKNYKKDLQAFFKENIACLARSSLMFVSLIFILLIRLAVMEFSKPSFTPVDNPSSFIKNPFMRFLNYNYIYSLNVWLLVCPEWLCFDWSMDCVPIIKAIDIRAINIVLLWCFLFALLKVIFINEKGTNCKEVTISMILLVIPFLPSSNLMFSVGFVIAERALYIPSAGYCLLIAIGLKRLSENVSIPKVVSLLYYTLILLFFCRSWIRSEEWNSELSLFKSGLKVCPLNAKVHYNVAKSLADAGNIYYAKLEYLEAIRLYPKYVQALNNLGNLHKAEGEYEKAEKLFMKAISYQEDFATAWMNLGIVLSASRKYDKAEESYLKAISYRKHYPDCYFNLGLLHLAKKEYTKALAMWKTSTRQKKKHKKAWNNIILLLNNLDKTDEALRVANSALYYVPKDSSIHFNIGNIYGKKGEFEKAEQHFKKAISIDNNNSVIYTNLGVLYHRWKKFKNAEHMYKKALLIDPNSQAAQENYSKLKKFKTNR